MVQSGSRPVHGGSEVVQGGIRRNHAGIKNDAYRAKYSGQSRNQMRDACFPVLLRWESSRQAKDFSFEGMKGHGLLHQIILIS